MNAILSKRQFDSLMAMLLALTKAQPLLEYMRMTLSLDV